MFGAIGGWFTGLSALGKAGAATAAVVVAGTGVSVVPPAVCNATSEVSYTDKVITVDAPFETHETESANMNIGQSTVQTAGVNGQNRETHHIGTKCKKEVSNKIVKIEELSKPVTEEKTVGVKEITTETQDVAIPFSNQNVSDPTMDKGTTQVTQNGANGNKRVTYSIAKVHGQEQSRTPVKEEVTLQPVTQITHIGTKVASSCDPNYSGGCVPIASDVDCGGGSGNGPAYFYGTARVVGSDIYGLDRDGDRIACE